MDQTVSASIINHFGIFYCHYTVSYIKMLDTLFPEYKQWVMIIELDVACRNLWSNVGIILVMFVNEKTISLWPVINIRALFRIFWLDVMRHCSRCNDVFWDKENPPVWIKLHFVRRIFTFCEAKNASELEFLTFLNVQLQQVTVILSSEYIIPEEGYLASK